jgi:hypothetical protein
MPLFLIPLATWFSTTFISIITYFVTKKGILFASLLTILTAVGLLISAFISEFEGLLLSVLPAAASFAVAFVPSNLTFCLSTIVSAHLAATAFKVSIKLINWKTKVMTS